MVLPHGQVLIELLDIDRILRFGRLRNTFTLLPVYSLWQSASYALSQPEQVEKKNYKVSSEQKAMNV